MEGFPTTEQKEASGTQDNVFDLGTRLRANAANGEQATIIAPSIEAAEEAGEVLGFEIDGPIATWIRGLKKGDQVMLVMKDQAYPGCTFVDQVSLKVPKAPPGDGMVMVAPGVMSQVPWPKTFEGRRGPFLQAGMIWFDRDGKVLEYEYPQQMEIDGAYVRPWMEEHATLRERRIILRRYEKFDWAQLSLEALKAIDQAVKADLGML